MTIKLPPKPEMVQIDRHIPTNYVIRGYTAEQMESYAREAVRLNMAPLSVDQASDLMRELTKTKCVGSRGWGWIDVIRATEAAHGIKGD